MWPSEMNLRPRVVWPGGVLMGFRGGERAGREGGCLEVFFFSTINIGGPSCGYFYGTAPEYFLFFSLFFLLDSSELLTISWSKIQQIPPKHPKNFPSKRK
jgi:hypothetical protein